MEAILSTASSILAEWESGRRPAVLTLEALEVLTECGSRPEINPQQQAARKYQRSLGRLLNRLVWLHLRCARPLADWPALQTGYDEGQAAQLKDTLMSRVDLALTRVYEQLDLLRERRMPIDPQAQLESIERYTRTLEGLCARLAPRGILRAGELEASLRR